MGRVEREVTEDGGPTIRYRDNPERKARQMTLAESVDVIIKIIRRRRSGGYSVHTSSRGRLPDLISFSSKHARIGDIFSHQVEGDD